MGGCISHAQDWSWKHPLSLGSRGNLLTINMRVMVHVSYTGSDEGQRLDICYFFVEMQARLKILSKQTTQSICKNQQLVNLPLYWFS